MWYFYSQWTSIRIQLSEWSFICDPYLTMSLDLYLFEQQSGEEPSDTIENILEEEEERLGNDEDGEPSIPERLKQVLNELNEKYKWSEFDPDSNALSHDKYGMTLEAYSKYFVINIAYWQEGEDSTEVVNFANNVIQTCRRLIPGLLIYDPQEDEVKESLSDTTSDTMSSMSKIPGIAKEENARGSQKP